LLLLLLRRAKVAGLIRDVNHSTWELLLVLWAEDCGLGLIGSNGWRDGRRGLVVLAREIEPSSGLLLGLILLMVLVHSGEGRWREGKERRGKV